MNFTKAWAKMDLLISQNKAKMETNRTAGKKTGILYDSLTKSSVSSEGPTWWHVNEKVPVNTIKKKRRHADWHDMSTAESSDAPD